MEEEVTRRLAQALLVQFLCTMSVCFQCVPVIIYLDRQSLVPYCLLCILY